MLFELLRKEKRRCSFYKLITPNERYRCVTDICPQELWQRGLRGLILDLDNTLLPWDSEVVPEKVKIWLQQLQAQGFELGMVSNNQRKRVAMVAKPLNAPYACRAYKPSSKGFRSVAAAMRLPLAAIAVIGDQLFTDMLGGNRLGMHTIWVRPIAAREFAGTKITRCLERFVLRRLAVRGMLPPERGRTDD
ncbi:YqeG family HAD IIIA-type phosphatase [Azotosporobacter soli]|uniref:YqeG family HAD IIIA-type phosphatase n=1 Tax=Azotosporobacter soli TaxID=3055040 RepID=UPI0031FE57CC